MSCAASWTKPDARAPTTSSSQLAPRHSLFKTRMRAIAIARPTNLPEPEMPNPTVSTRLRTLQHQEQLTSDAIARLAAIDAGLGGLAAELATQHSAMVSTVILNATSGLKGIQHLAASTAARLHGQATSGSGLDSEAVVLLSKLTAEEIRAVQRFHETASDEGTYDINTKMRSRLRKLGLIRHAGRSMFEETSLMQALLQVMASGR
jgi:hypothetical protein